MICPQCEYLNFNVGDSFSVHYIELTIFDSNGCYSSDKIYQDSNESEIGDLTKEVGLPRIYYTKKIIYCELICSAEDCAPKLLTYRKYGTSNGLRPVPMLC